MLDSTAPGYIVHNCKVHRTNDTQIVIEDMPTSNNTKT